MSRRNGIAVRLRPGVAFGLSWLFPLFPRPLGLLSRLSGRRVTLTWQPWSGTSVLVRTTLLAGCYPLPKIGIKRWSRASILVRAAFHAVRHEMPSGWMGGKPKEG